MEKKTKVLVGAFAGTLFIGIGMGALTQPAPVVAEPLPAVTITPEPVEVTVEKTPAICLTAIDRAEQMNALSAEFSGSVRDLLHGIGAGEIISSLESFNASVPALTDRMEAVDFVSAATACRATA